MIKSKRRRGMKRKKIYYGWIIVIASFLVTMVGLGAINSMTGVLVKPVCDELGFSRAEFSFYRTVITLVGTFLMPFYGRRIQQIGVKKIMLVCSVALPLVTFAYSFSTKIWHFYLIAAVNGLFLNGLSFMVVGILIRNWFQDKQGIATGLAYAGSGIGAAILAPIVGYIVEYMSWQAVYRVVAIIVLAIALPTVIFLVRERPEEMGLEQYRDKKGKNGREVPAARGITLKESMRTPTFWLLMIAIFLLAIMAAAPNVHTVPYLTDIGYTTAFAASIVSSVMIMLTVAKIALGFFFDRFGALAGSLFLSVCCLVFPIVALMASKPVVPWVYSVFFGMASAGVSIPIAILAAKYFGNIEYAAIFSSFSMVSTLGQSVGAPVMGGIFDATGSYYGAWIMLLLFAAIITMTLVGAYLSSKKIMMMGK